MVDGNKLKKQPSRYQEVINEISIIKFQYFCSIHLEPLSSNCYHQSRRVIVVGKINLDYKKK